MTNKVIAITGPTGVGKTKLSVALAKLLHTEIISGDAYQIYKYMNIGTAKVKPSETGGITHHFIDILEPTEEYSVANYQKDVRELVNQMHDKELIPLIVGGTGLYIDSVCEDYRFSGEKRDDSFEDRFKDLSNEELHDHLKKLDPTRASLIHANNRKRVLRAIEIVTNNLDIDDNLKHQDVYPHLIIHLTAPRELLYDRINKRVDQMIEEGLVDEVKSLWPKSLGFTAQKAIGYKEIIAYLNDEINLDKAIDLIKQNSRHYAKRQLTWYRNHKNTVIIEVNYDDFDATISQCYDIIKEFLSK